MIQAVLFDLDETLLDLNLDAYVKSYSLAQVNLVAHIANTTPIRIAVPYWRALAGMLSERRDGLSNKSFLDRRFEELTGIPLGDPVIADCIDYYNREVFNPAARTSKAVGGKPRIGAHACLKACQDAGVKVVLATNPTFPETCTRERMAWAGLDGFAFDYATFVENSSNAKPWRAYYEQICTVLDVEPSRCLMVGNDPKNDFATGGLPLRTCYVGKPGKTRGAYWMGDMEELSHALPDLIERG